MVRRLCVAVAVSCCLMLLPIIAQAEEEPEFKNPNPVFKSNTPEMEKTLAAKKLGKPPKLSKDEMKQLVGGEILVRELPNQTKGAKRFEAIGIVKASPKAVMAFLRDFDSQVGVMPHLIKVDYTWDRNLAHMQQTLKIALMKINYTLNVLHYGDSVIEWEFVKGDIKDTSGYYKFFPFSKGKKTLVVYHVFNDPGMAVPDFIQDLLTKNSMPDVIQTIRKVVEK